MNETINSRLKTDSGGEALSSDDLHAIYRTTKKTIQEYVNELEKYNRYRTARSNVSFGSIMDNRAPLIDIYDMCVQQDAHLRSTIETLKSQVLGERYMLARVNNAGKYLRDINNTKKIQGTKFIKIINEIIDAKLYGYSLIELGDEFDKRTGKLTSVKTIDRRNILPDQGWITKRQGQFHPGWNIKDKAFQDRYIFVDNEDLGLFSALVPVVIAKKFTFANFTTYTQSYGQPIIQGKSEDDSGIGRQQLATNIAQSAAQRIIVTGLNEDLKIHALASSNSEQIFLGVINEAKQDISNLILGSSSMAGDTQSYVGSTNAHQDIFRDRVEVYREYIENIMNEEVIPRLEAMGMIDSGLEFKYSNKIEMSNADRINLYDKITDKYEVDKEEIEKEFGIVVGDQFNTARYNKETTTTPNKTATEKQARVNFLTGEGL